MKKYLLVSKNTFQEFLTYRLSFVLWRFRNIVSFLAILFFWLAVYKSRPSFLGYSSKQMYSYLLGIAFIKSLVFSSRTSDLGGMIRDGELSGILLIPVSVFKYFLSRDFSDKIINFSFSMLEIVLVAKIFNLPLYFPRNLHVLFFVLPLLVISFFLYFFLSLIISMSAFWTDDIWAVRYLVGVIFLEFFSGSFFPIDVLPVWMQKIIYFTPFPYLAYFPIKIWLEQINSTPEIIKVYAICLSWLVLFFVLAKIVWNKGLKQFGAYGG